MPSPDRRLAVAVVVLVLAAAPAAALPPVPTVESVAVLPPRPIPLPDGGQAAFHLGGVSDLVAAPGPDGITLWGITDRGPNGTVTEPGRDGAPPRTRRTLPVAGFAPLLMRFSLPALREGRLEVEETIALAAAAGKPASGRPATVDPRAKPIVDPKTLEQVVVDADGYDTEGLARLGDGRFWIAEEYVPSLAEVGPDGTVRRRLVPRGVTLPGASCPVEDTLPADFVERRENRGFEALAVSPDGRRLFAFLQSPLGPPPVVGGVGTPAEPVTEVPLVVLDPDSGRPVAEHAYPLGSPESDACKWCVAAADGKISAIAAAGPRTILVLEQSDTESRIYRVDVPEAPAPGRTPLEKVLLVDLATLAGRFQADIVPGASAPPERLSELKFEGMALLGPDRLALVNDNDFDIAADGGGPATPPARQTRLWVLRIPATP